MICKMSYSSIRLATIEKSVIKYTGKCQFVCKKIYKKTNKRNKMEMYVLRLETEVWGNVHWKEKS